MDTNYRGGPPGFVRTRLISTSSSPTSPTSTSNDTATHHELIWPEYSGNRLYQTLGNLFTTPKAGLVFPDLATGDALYVTGTTKLHFGADAAALIPRSNLVVSLVIDASRFVLAGLSFRAIQTDIPDISPYTPRLRVLANETGSSQSQPGPAKSTPVAALLSQTRLTPTISRFKFSLPGTVVWKPGQYVVLDFGAELAMGYAHMRDDDPRSLNDDFVRTFTVSSAPPEDKVSESQSQEASRPGKIRDTVFEVTMRRIRDGPVTEFLFKQGLGERRATAIPLEIGVLGFEGVFAFDLVAGLPTSTRLLYVASGVGITPLLAQMEMLVAAGLTNRLTLFWTLKVEDAAFALDVLDVLRGRSSHEQGETTGPTITLFITGSGTHGSGDGEAENEVIDQLTGKCSVVRRRFAETDFQAWRTAGEVSEKNEQREQVLLCANPSLTTLVQQWLTQIGVEARSEGFGY
jgi:NAD(P)H-flavin reductase